MSNEGAQNVPGRNQRRPLRHWLLFFLRILLGGVFAFSAWSKLLAPHAFADAIGAFQILPEHLWMIVAVILIWHELICGTFMLLGLWTRATAIVMCVLLGTFLLAVVSAMTKGLEIACGCFGSFSETDLGWPALLRILALLIFSGLLLYFGSWKYSLDLVVKVNQRIRAGLPGWRKD